MLGLCCDGRSDGITGTAVLKGHLAQGVVGTCTLDCVLLEYCLLWIGAISMLSFELSDVLEREQNPLVMLLLVLHCGGLAVEGIRGGIELSKTESVSSSGSPGSGGLPEVTGLVHMTLYVEPAVLEIYGFVVGRGSGSEASR